MVFHTGDEFLTESLGFRLQNAEFPTIVIYILVWKYDHGWFWTPQI